MREGLAHARRDVANFSRQSTTWSDSQPALVAPVNAQVKGARGGEIIGEKLRLSNRDGHSFATNHLHHERWLGLDRVKEGYGQSFPEMERG
ncbi:MAG: hypothetical protein FWD68_07430 [Alphaproteobacteria bacterium]|nr:hypothetical protein [Alphaproteobacteria bacterium]